MDFFIFFLVRYAIRDLVRRGIYKALDHQTRISIFVFVLLFLFSGGKVSADPTTQPLLQSSDITYVGRFGLPDGGSTPATYDYGGYGMAFYKKSDDTKTLYVSGHVYGPGYYGQVQVPADSQLKSASTGYSSLTKASVIQSIADAMEGHGNVENNGNGNFSMGIFPYNGKLIITAVNSYSFSNLGGHLVRDTLNVSGTGHVKPSSGLYSMTGGAPQRAIAGYMFLIPPEWRPLLGNMPAVTGECCLSIISTTSGGPALTAFDPDQVGTSNPIPGINLLYYPTPTHPVSCPTDGACQSQVFNLTSRVLGGGFVPNSRTVFFVEGHGTGPYCYGTAQECGNDTVMSDVKGPHAQPYRYQILAYDANDLVAVKSGVKQSYDPRPYNAAAPWVLHEFDGEDPRGSAAAFDPESGRLYIRVGTHTSPTVDVYQVAIPNGTPDTTPPTSPTSLAATSPSQSSISVTWNPATDNVAVTGYLIERCQGSGCSNFAQVGTPTSSPFLDSSLTPNTFYNYHVRATDAAGNLSGWSNVVGATTQAPDTTPPTTPGTLQTSVVSSSNINLTWTASTDTVGVTGYKVERCTGSGCTNFTEIGTPTTTNYSDTGLSATTTYRYQVRAVDGAGNNSGYSTIASATTPIAPPTPTFVNEYETVWNSSASPKTTPNFSVQTGDILVAYAVNESSSSTIATPPTGTLSGTWTLRQTVSATDYTYLRLWTLPVTANQSNVNVSFSNGSGNFGGSVLHFRNASSVGVTAQATGTTGNPTLTLNGISENSSIVMVNGDWSAKTGNRTYNTTQAGTFTETSAYADGSTYGVEAGYYANAGTSGNKTIGITAPTGMKWALAAVELTGNASRGSEACHTVNTTNFSQSAYAVYGAPFDPYQTSVNLMGATCTRADPHTVNATLGVSGDTTRIVYTRGYWYDAVGSAWRQYSGTCTGALNGDWCQGSVSATITDANLSTASVASPTYFVGMVCRMVNSQWRCGCRDTTCSSFYWQIQGAGF